MKNENLETWILNPERMNEVLEAYEAARRLFDCQLHMQVQLHVGEALPFTSYISVKCNPLFIVNDKEDLYTLLRHADNMEFYVNLDRQVVMNFTVYNTAIDLNDPTCPTHQVKPFSGKECELSLLEDEAINPMRVTPFETVADLIAEAMADKPGQWQPDSERLKELRNLCTILESLLLEYDVDYLDTELKTCANDHTFTFTFEMPCYAPSDAEDRRMEALLLLSSSTSFLSRRGETVRVSLKVKM